MNRHLAGWFAAAIGGAIGGLLIYLMGQLLCSGPQPPPVSPPADTLPDAEVKRGRPDTAAPSGLTRIVRVRVPVGREVSRGTPDSALATRYAELARKFARYRIEQEQDSLARLRGEVSDTTPPPAPPPSILPPVTGRYDGSRLTLHLTESSGRIMRATARVKPRFSFVAGHGGVSDTLPLVDSDRWFVRVARETVRCSPKVGANAGLGALLNTDDRVLGAVLAGGGTLLGCLL